MDRKQRKRLEKILFSLLGKAPGSFLAILDDEGWLSVKEIHRILASIKGIGFLTPALIRQFVELYQPEKFEISNNRIRVRPEYMDMDLLIMEYASPPERLYVPVRPRAHAHVLKNGLIPPSNKSWIVLATDNESAMTIGMRRDKEPLISEVNCAMAENLGVSFFRADGPLYLAERLPPEALALPPLPEEQEHAKISRGTGHSSKGEDKVGKRDEKAKSAPSTVTPGSFFPDAPPSFIKKEDKNRKGRKRKPSWKDERRKAKRHFR